MSYVNIFLFLICLTASICSNSPSVSPPPAAAVPSPQLPAILPSPLDPLDPLDPLALTTRATHLRPSCPNPVNEEEEEHLKKIRRLELHRLEMQIETEKAKADAERAKAEADRTRREAEYHRMLLYKAQIEALNKNKQS